MAYNLRSIEQGSAEIVVHNPTGYQSHFGSSEAIKFFKTHPEANVIFAYTSEIKEAKYYYASFWRSDLRIE